VGSMGRFRDCKYRLSRWVQANHQVSAGTFLGEVSLPLDHRVQADVQFGNFYAFKYCLRGTAIKYEKKNLNYALMAHIVREGGFWIVFVSRLSAIPG
jgi:hypothetical protein